MSDLEFWQGYQLQDFSNMFANYALVKLILRRTIQDLNILCKWSVHCEYALMHKVHATIIGQIQGGVQILSFSCIFQQSSCKITDCHILRDLVPLFPWKSLIRI